jgi:hypothetical protein
MVATRLLPVCLTLLVMGCSGPELAVNNKGYCERERGDPSTADCIFIGPEKDGDPATLGRIAVKSRVSASAYVRRAGKKKYTLHRDGKIVGSIMITGDNADWIEVTLTDGAPYKKTMRADGPGGLME